MTWLVKRLSMMQKSLNWYNFTSYIYKIIASCFHLYCIFFIIIQNHFDEAVEGREPRRALKRKREDSKGVVRSSSKLPRDQSGIRDVKVTDKTLFFKYFKNSKLVEFLVYHFPVLRLIGSSLLMVFSKLLLWWCYFFWKCFEPLRW